MSDAKLEINGADVLIHVQLSPSGISYLEGKLLTQIEASMPDDRQCKALKDVIRDTLWTWAKGYLQPVKNGNGVFPVTGIGNTTLNSKNFQLEATPTN